MNKQFDDLVKKAVGVNGTLVGDILHEDVMSKFWFQGLVSNQFAHLPSFLGDEYSGCSNVDFEQIVDCTSEFTTNEIFNSREELIRWAREVGKANGFVIVTLRSDQGGKGNKKPRVTLGCEREESEKHGLKHLRNVLLREILNEKDLTIGTPSIGSTYVRERLSNTKVLIVLDDVSASTQLELLVGDHFQFGSGSQITITTRDRRLLKKKVDDDKIYKVEGLSYDEARGMPLALKILGSLFLHCDNNHEREDELNNLKKFPNQEIENMLKLSYDGLEKNAKEIFLDIACFYKGMKIDFAKEMLHICGVFAGGIKVLIEKSLVSISRWNCLEMHDLVQKMGRTIVYEQCIEEPGRRSRLFIAQDIYRILRNNTGTEAVQAIFFNSSKSGQLRLDHADFKKMHNLSLLNVDSSFGKYCKLKVSLPNSLGYLCWEEYPLKSLPSKFSPENLVELRMCGSKKLSNFGIKSRGLLIYLQFFGTSKRSKSTRDGGDKNTRCSEFEDFPEIWEPMGHLKILLLNGTAVKELPSSIECCSKFEDFPEIWEPMGHVKVLLLNGTAVKVLPSSIECLFGCSEFEDFPEIWEPMGHLKCLLLNGTAVKELPSSIKCLFALPRIGLKNCKRLVSLPPSICKLKSLKELDLTGCSEFEDLHEILEPMGELEFLGLERTSVKGCDSRRLEI
ncbi:PREDICTED: TMV resistance protein N-like [Prunus mume]|uniref:TMV resistance protein N-like n=1 Tax=Prunus mume TaxID=102107 RepID=A0ABM0PAC9_PRUMU|nr:PREDICTED: TMV resistance protein N-like [Prunus mume]